MTEELTNRDVIEALHESMQAMEKRLNAKIDALSLKIDRVKNDLSAEIAGSYDLHEERIKRLETAVGE